MRGIHGLYVRAGRGRGASTGAGGPTERKTSGGIIAANSMKGSRRLTWFRELVRPERAFALFEFDGRRQADRLAGAERRLIG